MAALLFAPTPHDEAIDFIKGKPALTSEVYSQLLPELKPLAFTVAGVQAADAVQSIRDLVAALPTGQSWDESKRSIASAISRWVVDPNASAEDQAKQEHGAQAKAELLLRLHGGQAYAAATEQVLQRQKKAFPYSQYLTMGDGRVRPSHRALDGVILPVDDPFWSDHTPPWAWGCRCTKVAISRSDYADTLKEDASKPADQKRILDDFTRTRLETDCKLVRNGQDVDVRTDTELGKSSPYQWNPLNLRPDLAQLKARYDATTWAEFQAFAERTALPSPTGAKSDIFSLWQWLGGQASAPPPTVAATPTPAPAPPAPPALPPTKSVSEAVARAGLDLSADATLPQLERLLDELREESPAPAASTIVSINGASGYNLISQQTLLDMHEEFLGYLPPSLVASLPAIKVIVAPNLDALGKFDPVAKELSLYGNALDNDLEALRKTYWHELIHWVHDTAPVTTYRAQMRRFFRDRTGNASEPVVQLAAGPGAFYSATTTGMRDDWADLIGDEYAGRIYPGETPGSPYGSEIATRHLEKLAFPSVDLLEYWNFKSAKSGDYAWRKAFLEALEMFYLTP